jgi:hypothetical protein
MDLFPMSNTITVLTPKVTRGEAFRTLRPGIARRLATGPLRSLADVYVPFRVNRVEITSGGITRTRFLAFDAAFGLLDPYEFESVPDDAQTISVKTRNAAPILVDEALAVRRLEDKVRRVAFSEGFFRLRNMAMRIEPLPVIVHLPYWIGFYGSGECASIQVIDAVRRTREGSKMRHALTRWLTA